MDEEGDILKYLGPDTYKDKLLSPAAHRIVFIIYHLMKLRNGDRMPSLVQLEAIANEHDLGRASLEDLIAYERWLNLDLPEAI